MGLGVNTDCHDHGETTWGYISQSTLIDPIVITSYITLPSSLGGTIAVGLENSI